MNARKIREDKSPHLYIQPTDCVYNDYLLTRANLIAISPRNVSLWNNLTLRNNHLSSKVVNLLM